MPTIKKYTDWGNYWLGLRTNLFKCIGTTGTGWLGSNGLSASGIPGTENLAIDWQQAIGLFAIHLGWEIFDYMKKQQPRVITVTEETTHITKDSVTGVSESGTSKTVTTTPIEPNKP